MTNLDIERHGVGNELADDLLQVRCGNLALDDVKHLLADLTDLKGFKMASRLLLKEATNTFNSSNLKQKSEP